MSIKEHQHATDLVYEAFYGISMDRDYATKTNFLNSSYEFLPPRTIEVQPTESSALIYPSLSLSRWLHRDLCFVTRHKLTFQRPAWFPNPSSWAANLTLLPLFRFTLSSEIALNYPDCNRVWKMNADVEFHIRNSYTWTKLPSNIKQVVAPHLPSPNSMLNITSSIFN